MMDHLEKMEGEFLNDLPNGKEEKSATTATSVPDCKHYERHCAFIVSMMERSVLRKGCCEQVIWA